ncbi:MAG: hypothetical protein R3C14_43165 [Caldilineaceae bacterium]
MSLPFARSERSLQTDDYRTALICALLVLPLFIAWLVWFFAADLPVQEVSQQLTVDDEDTLVANFTLADLPNLQAGDDAWLRLRLPGSEQLTLIPVTVSDIRQRRDESYDIYLDLSGDYIPVTSLPLAGGQAAVDVDKRSPFNYLMQLGSR